jgi:DMSO/TMAO reductase YedYZ heme-binding membrane subunit
LNKRIVILLTVLFVLVFSSIASAKVEMGMTGSAVQRVQYMLIATGYQMEPMVCLAVVHKLLCDAFKQIMA